MRVTLNDIATRVGVTKTAVSMALRGGSGISQAMREEIRRVANEMGYAPDPILQRLSEYRRRGAGGRLCGVIAWVNHWERPEQLLGYREFEEYWRGARSAARRLGYRVEEFVWPADWEAERAEQRLRERGVLGLLLPPHKPEVEWGGFDWSKFSLIRFGMTVREVDANLVTADHQRAMVMAAGKIHEYGYRRIGLVYDADHDCSMGGNLYGGFLWAGEMLRFEEKIPALDAKRTPRLLPLMRRRLGEWMRKYRPDAILTAVPETPGLLGELGFQIPEDVAVASTSPYDISVDAGIDQCPQAIGETAAEMLIKQISLNERGEPADPCRILIESRWRDGRSLPARPAGAGSFTVTAR